MTEAPDVDLKPHEVDRICHPLKQRAAKVRFLRAMGLTVRLTAGGDPLVNRAHYNSVMGGRPLEPGETAEHGPAANETPQAAVIALKNWDAQRKARSGKAA